MNLLKSLVRHCAETVLDRSPYMPVRGLRVGLVLLSPIFTAGFTIMGLHSLMKLLQWGRTFFEILGVRKVSYIGI